MQDKQKRFVGENALQKMQRLLKDFSDQNVAGDGAIDLLIRPDGRGSLVHMRPIDPEDEGEQVIFQFVSLDGLMQFLEASPVERLKMVRAF